MINFSYWPDLDVALRKAAYRGVRVRLLISQWPHTRKEIQHYLKSLMDISPAMKSGSIDAVRLDSITLEYSFRIEISSNHGNKRKKGMTHRE